MKSARMVSLLLLVVVAAGVVAYGPACPLGTIASDSEAVVGKFGTVAVEACLVRVGAEDTYVYRLTNLGGGTEEVCALAVSGLGLFPTLHMDAPSGWSTSATDAADCASWWGFASISHIAGDGLGPGESATFSFTLPGPTTPANVWASLNACGVAETPFDILGPSACPDVTEHSLHESCLCTAAGCAGVPSFEGAGTRIQILGGSGTQTIESCSPSWVRHGFIGSFMTPADGEFTLTVDGVPVLLDVEVTCLPSSTYGEPLHGVFFYIQFPDGYFTPGIYSLVGTWEVFPTATDPGFTYTRDITLEVTECSRCIPDPGCVAFVGDGPRIHLLGPATQTIPECEPSWIEHGFIGPGATPGESEFRLYIEGSLFPLDIDTCCLDTGAAPLERLMYYVQFPPYFFPPGVYTLIGEWEKFPAAADPGYFFTRTITLIVDPCAGEPIPMTPPKLPNLTVRVTRDDCECAYDQQQRYMCTLSVHAFVKNDGAVAAPASELLLDTQRGSVPAQVPPLNPGSGVTMRLQLAYQVEGPGSPEILCPLNYEVAIDPRNVIEEVSETDNVDSGKPCCE